MRASFLLSFFILIVEISAFNFYNYQIPSYTTRNEHRFKTSIVTGVPGFAYSIPGGGTVTPTVYRSPGVRVDTTSFGTTTVTVGAAGSYGAVNPTFKYANSYVQTFKPIGANVLISYTADDDGVAYDSNGNTFQSQSQSSLLTGIVVAVGTVKSSRLAEGTRVYFHPHCALRWDGTPTRTWTATYSQEKAKMMANKFINGVDLNNADGWNTMWNPYNPALYYGGTLNRPSVFNTVLTPSTTMLNAANVANANTGDNEYLTGTQNTVTTRLPNDIPGANADDPTMNPNQQSNYLLCAEDDVLGIVSENGYPNIDAGHYELPSNFLRALRNPSPTNQNTLITNSNV